MESGPKKTALWLLIGSVVISALLGIWAIVSGDFGEFQVKVLLTTLTITGASVCGLCCGAYWEKGRNRWLPAIGILLAIGAAAGLIYGIWFQPKGDYLWRFLASAWIVAIATAHVCLLSLARLSSRFAWAMIAAYVVIYLLAGLGVTVFFINDPGEGLFRAIGVVAILVGAISLIVPIFHWMSRQDFKADPSSQPDEASLWATVTCPQCGRAHANSRLPIECNHCGCVFKIMLLRTGGAPSAATQD